MPLYDNIITASRRPDCLLALLPGNDGMLLNPLRPGSSMYPNSEVAADSPSWAVRNGLLEMKNIKTAGGRFASQDSTQIASVNTRLDLSGNNSSKTFIARAYCPRHDDGKLHIHAFITQGIHSGAAANCVLMFSIWEYADRAIIRGYCCTDQYSWLGRDGNLELSEFDQEHTFAVSFDYDNYPDRIQTSIFVDGVLRAQVFHTQKPWNTLVTSDYTNTVAIRNDTAVNFIADHSVSWALIFDSLLRPTEIQALV